MRLDPGPIPAITSTWLDSSIEQPGFSPLVEAWLQLTAVVEAQLDATLDADLVIDAILPEDGIISVLDDIGAGATSAAGYVDPAQFDQIESYKTAGDAAMIDAYQSTPGEAFTAVPLPTSEGGGPAPTPVASQADVSFVPDDGRGGTVFREGDPYTLTVQLDTNAPQLAQYYQVDLNLVTVHDNAEGPHLDLGTTDLNGSVKYEGAWSGGDAGAWSAQIIATTKDGNQTVAANLNWTVFLAQSDTTPGTPGAPAPAPDLVRVSLTGVAQDSSVAVHVGDFWQLDIYGPANAPVVISGLFNDDPLAPVTLGNTDTLGHYQQVGQFSFADSGRWTEYYTVGGFQWAHRLNFQVLAGVTE